MLRERRQEEKENYEAPLTQTQTSYEGPPSGLDEVLGEIDEALSQETISEQYRQKGGQ